MKKKQIISALALALAIGMGASTVANAATQNDFNMHGSNGMQNGEAFEGTLPTPSTPMDIEGEIELNGTFNKVIDTFPAPTQTGYYLRVTMPIKMDFTYDTDMKQLTSADAKVVNRSVYAEVTTSGNTNTVSKMDYKPIEMKFMDVTKKSTGNGPDVKFVDKIDESDKDNLQLPFMMKVSSDNGVVNNYNLKDIEGNSKTGNVKPIQIPASSTLELKLGLITGQSVGNTELIKKATTSVKHDLKLRFEYSGK